MDDSFSTDSHSRGSGHSSDDTTIKALSSDGSENSPRDFAMKSPETSLKGSFPGENAAKSCSFEFVKPKDLKEQMIILKPQKCPPSRQEILDSLSQHNLSETQNQDAFFSCDKDIADKARSVPNPFLRIYSHSQSQNFKNRYNSHSLSILHARNLSLLMEERPLFVFLKEFFFL